MSILIKGMEMPTRCERCGFLKVIYEPPICGLTETKVLGRGNARLDNCPLVPVPPHGRLIDADALEYRADNVRDPMGRTEKTVMWRYIQNAPTVIPSEQGDET